MKSVQNLAESWSREMRFPGHCREENSLNPHLLLKHFRDISTPRLSVTGCGFSSGAPLNMTDGNGLARELSRHKPLELSASGWVAFHHLPVPPAKTALSSKLQAPRKNEACGNLWAACSHRTAGRDASAALGIRSA